MATERENLEKAHIHRMYLPPGPFIANNPQDAFASLRSTIPLTANPITSQLSYGRKAIPNLVL
jgi:hypothetical protein